MRLNPACMTKERTVGALLLVQFLKFGIVGLSNTAISYAVYALLVLADVHYLVANTAAFVVGVLNAFYWSNKYVFTLSAAERRNTLWTLAKIFVTYGFTGLLLNSFLLYILIDCRSFNDLLAQLICLVITVPANFLLNKFWSFKTKSL